MTPTMRLQEMIHGKEYYAVVHTHKLYVEGKGTLAIITLWLADIRRQQQRCPDREKIYSKKGESGNATEYFFAAPTMRLRDMLDKEHYHVKHIHRLYIEGKGTVATVTLWLADKDE